MQIQNQNQIFVPEILDSGGPPALPEVPPPDSVALGPNYQYFQLQWSWPGDEAGITGFLVYYSTDPDNLDQVSDPLPPSTRDWELEVNLPETQHYFKVVVIVDAGAGIYNPVPPTAESEVVHDEVVDYLIHDGEVANFNLVDSLWHTVTGNDSGDGGNIVFGTNSKLTTITLDNISSAGSISISNNALLTGISFAALATVTNEFTFSNNDSYSNTIQFNPGASMSLGQLAVIDNAALTSLTFSNTITFTNSSTPIVVENNPSLATLTIDDDFLWTDGATVSFATCALVAAAVNRMLDNALNGNTLTSGTLDLSGGTNAAPTGQGIADKATLQANGVTVNTN